MAKPFKRQDSRYWWIAPMINGVQCPQSSKTESYADALKQLRKLEGKVASDAPLTPKTDRGLFGALLDDVITDYQVRDRRSLYDLKIRIRKHVRPGLGDLKASAIRRHHIADYILDRKTEKASNATINRELAIIKRAFTLGRRSGEVSEAPFIEMLEEAEARQGFFEEKQFRALLRHCEPLLADILTVAYYTGWRLKSILGLGWASVTDDLIRLRKNETKNRKATVCPLSPFPDMAKALARRRAETKKVERRKSMVIPYVFHRDGEPVKSIRGAFNAARIKAGIPGRRFHDFRRSAVRNLTFDGWAETDGMNIVGMKTRSTYQRYNITIEDDILRKADRLSGAR